MNYYNEIDPKAAAWLRELIRAGEIADGFVDERSILEVKPHDLHGYTQCHFFAGIGGWSRALRLAGWPSDRPVWTGSCPCQPFSDAGLGRGTADERHLWPAFFNLIAQCHPAIVFGEQVASKAALAWLDGVCADLEGAGYAVGAADLCAAGVGSPQIRQRLYWMGYSMRGGRNEGPGQLGQVGCARSGQLELAVASESVGMADADGEQKLAANSRGLYAEFVSGGTALGLADANGRDASAEGLQRGGEHGQRAEDTGIGRLGHAVEPGLEGHGGHEHDGRESGWLDSPAGRSVAATGATGFWDICDLLPCTDGAQRRIEPGSFPLVDGLPGRVGLLRGYGNAIVPPLAAEFIRACEEARICRDLIG